MKQPLFDDLMKSMDEALAHARGKRELRTTVLPDAPRPMSADDIRSLRDRVRASQAVFARFLNVSPQLVRAWEANRRRPEGAALRLLELATRNPETVFGSSGATYPPIVSTKRGRMVAEPAVALARKSSAK